MPPGTLTRRYRFDERIRLSQQTLDAFVRAGLLRPYDPVVALTTLKSTLGKNATDTRREEALDRTALEFGERLPLNRVKECLEAL